MPVIGFLSSRSAEDSERVVAAFRQGLAEAGYVEGRDVAIEFRWAQGQFDRLPALAAELVARPVDVLAAVAGNQAPRAAKAATTTIPIVFAIGEDPVKEGLLDTTTRSLTAAGQAIQSIPAANCKNMASFACPGIRELVLAGVRPRQNVFTQPRPKAVIRWGRALTSTASGSPCSVPI